MADFWTHDGEYVTSMGSASDGQEQQLAPDGHVLVIGSPPMNVADRPDITARWNLKLGRWDSWSPPSDQQYVFDRRKAYLDVGDQLDALWHAMDDGRLPQIEPFYSDILAVKEQFPKPSN